MLTPKDLQDVTFGKAVFGGYDMRDVDEVLEPLIEDYSTLYKENSVLKSKLKVLVEKLEEYRTQEASMKRAMVAAQQTNEMIIADAQKRASQIISEAEAAAGAKQTSAENDIAGERAKFEAERLRTEQAKAAANSFIDALESEIAKHTALLENIRKYAAMPVEKSSAAQDRTAAQTEAASGVKAEPKNPQITVKQKSTPKAETVPAVQPIEEGENFSFFDFDKSAAVEADSTVKEEKSKNESAFSLDDLNFDQSFEIG